MTRTTMTLSALLALVSSGLIYEVGKEAAPVEIAAAVDSAAVELKTADAAILLDEIKQAGAGDDARCEMVHFANYDGCYCWSGATGGWPSDSSACKAIVQVRDGKVFVSDVALASEAVVEAPIK